MDARLALSKRMRSAFTLIELLVVVAIIALLISILLPSLSRARAQARATICGTRIGQLTKAILMYADDFDETPPFIACGHKDCRDEEVYDNLGDDGQNSEQYFMRFESWLIPGEYWVEPTRIMYEPDWSLLPDGGPTAREGTLFPYTRFENLYRCPDFERVSDPSKSQNVFNYTRTVLGRKALSALEPMKDEEAGGEPLHPGHIMKLSAVYSPSALIMMLDEQWDFHCAAGGPRGERGGYEYGGSVGISGMWMAGECMHSLVGDMVGSYHGTLGKVIDWVEIKPSKMGSLAYYDGHTDLARDPWPWREAEDQDLFALLARVGAEPETGIKVIGLLLESIFGQRGIAFGLEEAVYLVTNL